jgi:L-asparaginase/Glu-tRNA(Gln) amidotransferase subunit D
MVGLLPRVGLILTGGTIDSVGTDRLDLAWYIEANKRLGDGELLAQLPELKSIARVQEMPFRRLPSQALVDSDWLDLVARVNQFERISDSLSSPTTGEGGNHGGEGDFGKEVCCEAERRGTRTA